MIKRYVTAAVLSVFLGGMCLSLAPGYNDNSSSPQNGPRRIKPGVSDDASDAQSHRQANGRQETAYIDERDEDIHHRANRMGDWDYKQNWRYNRKAFYNGEWQGDAYEEEHNPYAGGIGMYPDREYMQMRQYYEESRRNQQNGNANRRPYDNRQNGNNGYNGRGYSGYANEVGDNAQPSSRGGYRQSYNGTNQNAGSNYRGNNNPSYNQEDYRTNRY